MAGEQHKPEFVAINPQHCVPTIVDGDVKLWESRSIIRYMARKYAPESGLYPTDLAAAAKVDQLLDYDHGTLYNRFGKWFYPLCFRGADADSDESAANLKSLHGTLKLCNDSFLAGDGKFFTGDVITIADISIAASMTMLEVAGVDIGEYKNIQDFMKNCKESIADWAKINDDGCAQFGGMWKDVQEKAKAAKEAAKEAANEAKEAGDS